MIQERHILLLSDEFENASELKAVLAHHHPVVEMKIVENFQQHGIVSRRRPPGLIIIMNARGANSHIPLLKYLRETRGFKEIPVFVYCGRPDKQEMDELLKEVNKND